MGPSGPGASGGKGWISVREPMDGASRFRIVFGAFAIVLALLSAMALLNILLVEPLPTGSGEGDSGGDSGNPGSPFDQPGDNDGDTDGDGDGDQGGGQGGKKDPCGPAEDIVGGVSITFCILAILLWVVAVWWRQKKQTRVMNGFAIGALVVTLVALTALFAWWIVHKICNLEVFNLKACLEIAHGLRTMFIVFVIPAVGLLTYAIIRWRQDKGFWGIFSGGGFVFLYLTILALAGWLVAEDICERQFDVDKDDLEKLPDGEDPDGPGGDTGDPGDGNDPDTGSPGGDPGGGNPRGGGDSGFGDGGGGRASPALPEISPFFLLIILGIAALVTILVIAVKGRQDGIRMAGAKLRGVGGDGDIMDLFTETDLLSNDRVVAAYREWLDHCDLESVPKKAIETPREHGKRAAARLKLDYERMKPLLDAYHVIRLSDRDATPTERTQAYQTKRLWRPKTVRATKVIKDPVPEDDE